MFNYTPKENQTKEKKGDKKRKRFGGGKGGWKKVPKTQCEKNIKL